jgi:hypothetical protein
MRIAAFILSIVVSTVLLLGGAFLLVVQASDSTSTVWVFVATVAMMMFVYGPLTLGSFRAYWDVTGSEESRTYYRRVLLVVLGLEVIAAIVTVVYAVSTAAGVVIPVVFIGSGAALTAVALIVGPAFYRYDRAHRPPDPGWVGIERRQVTRRLLAMAITFLGVVALGVIGFEIVSGFAGRALSVGQVLAFSLEFGFFAAGAVGLFSTLGWIRRLREVTDRDPSRLRRVARVVLRKKSIDLDERDLVAAARYAAVISVTLSFQTAYLVLLYAGLVLQQVTLLVTGENAGFSLFIVVLLVAVLVVILPLQIVRIRRARRYATEHAEQLDAQPA